MQKNIFYRLFLVLASLCLLAVAGCSDSQSTNTDTLQGSAVKGVISNAVVSLYSSDESKRLLTTSTTDQFGQFSFDLSELKITTPGLLELTVNQNTRMRCDLIEGCVNSQNGHLIEFGKLLPLPSDFKLLGLVFQDRYGQLNAHITPLSHLIVSTTLKYHEHLTDQSINTTSRWIQDAFKLNESPLQTQAKDITQLANMPIISEEQLKQSLFSAVLYPETLESTWKTGLITVDDLDLKSILERVTRQAQMLAEHIHNQNPNQEKNLLRIQSETVSQLDALENTEILILSQPVSLNQTIGSGFSFSVQAKSDYPLQYQWFHNGQAIAGANQNSFSKSSSKEEDAGLYSVVISHSEHQVSSLSANLLLEADALGLTITQQPQGQTLTKGDSLTLNVGAYGQGNLSYQWQRNGSLIPGATLASLHIPTVQSGDAGAYRVMVSDQQQTRYSDFVNVWVTEPNSQISITQHPQPQTLSEGSSVSFSVTAQGGGYLRYQWRRNGEEITNAYSNTFEISSISLDDEASYDVLVSNSQGVTLSEKAQLLVVPSSTPLIITQHPLSKSVIEGQATRFSVETINNSGLTYQWYFDDQPILNANNHTLSIPSAELNDQGSYYVQVSDSVQSALSQEAVLFVDRAPLHSIELNWNTPLYREDGSALSLSDIDGYVIQYGPAPNKMSRQVSIEGASNTSYTLRDLPSGSVFLSIATIDSDSRQGAFSPAISVTLP